MQFIITDNKDDEYYGELSSMIFLVIHLEFNRSIHLFTYLRYQI